MGANYLQTDDRDDYFAQFDRPAKPKKFYNVFDASGKQILSMCPQQILNNELRKHFGLTARWAKRGRARKLALQRGYKIEMIKEGKNNE